MRKERRWKETKLRGVKILRSDDGIQFIFYHEASKASLRIHNMPEGTRIECEAGAHVFVRKSGAVDILDTQGQHGQILGDSEIGYTDPQISTLEIPGTSALVRFDDNGAKTIFFDMTAKKISYPPALKNEKIDSLKQGQFFHTITLPFALAEAWGMPVADFMNSVKLVLSRDFNFDPDLVALNEIDLDTQGRAAYALGDAEIDAEYPRYDISFKGPKQWMPKLPPRAINMDDLRLPWQDTTEFTGHYVDVAKQFRIVRENDGVTCQTNLDQREMLWTQAGVFNAVSKGEIPPIQTVNKKTKAVNLLTMLERGYSLEDHRGRSWQYILLETKDAPHIAFEARSVLRAQFGLSAYQFTAINFDQGLCLLAMDSVSLAALIKAYRATTRMLDLIKSGSTDADAMHECLSAGANLRFMQPEAARGARSFVDIMEENKQTALLAALMARNGRKFTSLHA